MYLDGDANLDGAVIVDDLNVIGTNWATGSDVDPWSHGDFNADGTTNVTDLNLLALNWQKQIAIEAANGAAVPEPTSLALLLCALITGAYVRGRSSA